MILQNTRINTGHENYGFLLGYRNSRFYLLWTIMVTSRAFLFLPCSGQLPVMTPIRFKWFKVQDNKISNFTPLYIRSDITVLNFLQDKDHVYNCYIFAFKGTINAFNICGVNGSTKRWERRVTVVILCWLIHLEFIRSRTGVQKPVPCCPRQSLQNWTQKVLTSSLITSHTGIMNLNSFVSTKRENNQH